jgi:hypothetical protein
MGWSPRGGKGRDGLGKERLDPIGDLGLGATGELLTLYTILEDDTGRMCRVAIGGGEELQEL